MNIKVSVIIPVYNMEKYISECLDSVFGQTLKDDIEVICVDDGSTDGTCDILRRYKSHHFNMKLLIQNNIGPGVARNAALDVAEGEFVAFMDSDDYYPTEDVLEFLYNLAVDNNVCMSGGMIARPNCGEVVPMGDFLPDITDAVTDVSMCAHPYGFTAFIYKRQMLFDNDIRFPDYIVNEDPPFKVKAMFAADKMYVTSKCVYIYRLTDKKRDFSGDRYVCDEARGNLDMMHDAMEHQSIALQNRLLCLINTHIDDWFEAHIFRGNDSVSDIFCHISDYIMDSSDKQRFKEYWKREAVIDRVNKRIEEERQYSDKIKQFDRVIIYGAGGYGKRVYDFIENMESVTFVGFAVTDDRADITARGHKALCIGRYTEYKDDALVIIANKDNAAIEAMKGEAERNGFKNVMVVNTRLFGYEAFQRVR